MKRILSFILAFMVTLANGAVIYGMTPADVTGKAHEEAYIVLHGLGIVQGYEDGNFHPENAASRAEMSKIVCGLMGADVLDDMSGYAEESRFSDVPASHWASAYIHALANRGILEGFGDGTFEPETSVTWDQAVKILISVLGYTEAANQKGGFPAGCNAVAAQLGLTQGFSPVGDGAIARGDLIQLLYLALETDKMLDISVSEEEAWRVHRGETLLNDLETYKNIKVLRGQVMETALSSIVGGEAADEDEISIGGLICRCDGSAQRMDLLGKYVIAFAQYDFGADCYVIQSMEQPTGKNRMFTLNAKDVVSFQDNTYCYRDAQGKEKRLRVPRSISVVYNGAGLSVISAEDFEIVNGTLTFLDAGGTGEYNVLYINSYWSGVVSAVNAEGDLITFMKNRFEGISALQKKYDGERRYFISDQRGNPEAVDPGEIFALAVPWEDQVKPAAGNVVSVFESKDGRVVLAAVSDRAEKGTLNGMDYEKGKITLQEKELNLARYDREQWILAREDLKLSTFSAFYPDAFGDVVAADHAVGTPEPEVPGEETPAAQVKMGCVVQRRTTGGLASALMVQMLHGNILQKREELKRVEDEEEEEEKEEGVDTRVWTVYDQWVEVLECEEKITYNGKRMKSAELMELLPQNAVVYYQRNDAGKITSIKTPEAGTSLYRKFAEKNLIFGNGAPGGAFRADEDTMFFVIPRGAQTPEDYEIIYYMQDQSSHTITPYDLQQDFNSNSEIAAAAVIDSSIRAHENGIILTSTKVTLVESFSETLTEDGEVVRELSGYTDGERRSYLFRKDFSDSSLGKDIRVGDAVKLSIDVDGRVDNYKLLGRLSEKTPLYRAGIRSTDERALVKVYDKKVGVLQPLTLSMVDKLEVSFTGDYLDVSSYDINDQNRSSLYTYNRRTGKVSPAVVDEIVPYMSAGEEGASTLFLYISLNDLKAAVIVVD